MHRGGSSHTREEIIKQVVEEENTVTDWATYVPVGNAVMKLKTWKAQGASILYLTSRTKKNEVRSIKDVLQRYDFPDGRLLYRRKGRQYKDVAETVSPDILIEDDCESIGGMNEMTFTHIKPEIRAKIKSITVKEFGGIDHLPDKAEELPSYKE
jgi:hypothetical protein